MARETLGLPENLLGYGGGGEFDFFGPTSFSFLDQDYAASPTEEFVNSLGLPPTEQLSVGGKAQDPGAPTTRSVAPTLENAKTIAKFGLGFLSNPAMKSMGMLADVLGWSEAVGGLFGFPDLDISGIREIEAMESEEDYRARMDILEGLARGDFDMSAKGPDTSEPGAATSGGSPSTGSAGVGSGVGGAPGGSDFGRD